MKQFSQTLKRASLFTGAMLLLVQTVLPVTASASYTPPQPKITICHSHQPNPSQGGGQGPQNNPYNKESVSVSAADGIAGNSGQQPDHYSHNGPLFVPGTNQNYWGDIIPPIEGVHSGLNWTTEGQAIWNNDCSTKGSIKVIKDARPDSTDDFDFTVKKGASHVASFELEDDGSNNDGQRNYETVDGLVAGQYTITESPEQNGWKLTSISCNGGSAVNDLSNNKTTITLSVAENITCTFVNEKPGKIKVNKKVDANDNGVYEGGNTTANSLGFDWGLNDETPSRDMGSEASGLAAGQYTVHEDTLPGYVFKGWYFTDQEDNQGSRQVNCNNPQGTTLPVPVEVKNNQTTEITLCNQYKKGTVTVYKETLPANDTTLFGTTISTNNGVVAGSNSKNVSSLTPAVYEVSYGTYSVIENTIPEGWTNTGNTCESVVVNAQNPHASCTITNTKHGKVKVTKHTDPANDPANFDITASGTGTIYGDSERGISDGETETFYVMPGTFSVVESATEGWSMTNNTCANLVVEAGQTVECDIYNSKKAKVTIVKSTEYDSGDYEFQFTSPWANFGLTSGGQYTASNVDAGTYEIKEISENGWKLSGTWCYEFDWNRWTQIEGGIELEIKAGDDVTCYFYNEKLGSIGGFKLSDDNGNGAEDQGEEKLSGWTIELYKECDDYSDAARVLDIANENAIALPEEDCYEYVEETTTDANGNYEFANLESGNYRVCEVQRDGWTRTFPADSDCHDVYVSEGENCIANFANKPKEQGQVLGTSTSTPVVLANTGTPFAQGLIVGMSIIGAAAGVTYLSRRKQHPLQ